MDATILEKYKTFLRFERNLSKKTINGYLNNLRLVESKAGDLLLVQHRSAIVEAIEKIQKENGWNPEASTTWRCSHDICFFYKWAALDKHIPFNPYPFNGFRKPTYHAVEFTKTEEWDSIINSDMHLTHQDKLMLWIFWDTALRREELRLLDRENFNMEEKLIFLPEEKSKGGYGQRYVSMSDQTMELVIKQFALLDKLGVKPHVLCGDGYQRINCDQITERLIRAGKVFAPGGYVKLCPRAMRHSLGIRLKNAGASDLEIMTVLGHASLEMTRRYTHSTKSFAKSIRRNYIHGNVLQEA